MAHSPCTKCEEIDVLPTALQDKPKSPSRCLSRYRFTNSNSTFDGLASIKLLVKPDKNEAKQGSHTYGHECHYTVH